MNILPANLRFDPHGNAHCDTHGDIYFNPGKAQAKARELFHAAVDFDRRLAQSSNGNITVGELGFGLGMNFLTTWDIASQAGVHLHYVAIEGFPLGADQLKQAHDSAGLDSERAQALRAAWPGPVAGVHRVNLPGATLTLHQGDVVDAMASIDMRTQADVWFLDGFDPARNPAMWSPEVLAAVYEHTSPGGAAGTFSAAGAVRKALAHAGFEVQKIPGGSLKRHITQATKPVSPLSRAKPFCGHAAILGAGWAG
ncbi:MAG: tRNA (5-methylaminomethyl-2-thiouridine)(34)-methyltransferase MnmD, partial [Algisphaera sp.]